jgi:hypothetical protein
MFGHRERNHQSAKRFGKAREEAVRWFTPDFRLA